MREIVLDFESASAADLKEVGAQRYSEDFTTEILCLGFVVDEDEPQIWIPGEPLDEIKTLAADPNVLFIAHNVGFEKALWRNIMVPLYGMPDVPNSRWHDTMASCAMRAIPLDLDRAVTVTRLAHRKDKQESIFTKKLSKPKRNGNYDRSFDSLTRVQAYCMQDLYAERDLHKFVGPLTAGERNVWLLDQRINERGLLIDQAYVEAAEDVVEQATYPLIAEFQFITGLLPTQTQKFKAWIEGNGVYIDSLSAESIEMLLGEEIDDDADITQLSGCELPDHVWRALKIRSVVSSSSIKKLHRMRHCVCLSDGRARGLMQYHGAAPGRWAGRLLQPHNFPRGTIDKKKFSVQDIVSAVMTRDAKLIKMTIGEPLETIISSLRHAIVAATGRVLLSGDFAGIEARIVLAHSGQHDKTAIMAAGQDVYCDMATAIYKRQIEKELHPAERQVGKNAVLGLGFGMGWKKFKMKYAQDESEGFCQKIVSTYREDWAPCVPEMWYELDSAAFATVKTGKPHSAYGVEYAIEASWLTARMPSGRKLWYFNPTIVNRAMPWDDTDIRPAVAYQQMKKGQWMTIDAFGGLLTENVVQALARDLMVHAMFKLEKNGFPIILTVHDEIVCEPLAADADEKAFKQIMEDVPLFAKQMKIPIAVETWKGDRYRK